jgi:hypothetical protein
MDGLPVVTSKKHLGRRSRVDIAVTKNGKPNLDVKKIWIDTAATSCGIKVTQSDTYPVAWIFGNGVF